MPVSAYTLRDLIRRDWKANVANPKARLLLIAFRLTHHLAIRKESNRLVWILGLPLLAAYRVLFEWVLGIELPSKTRVGPGLKIDHGQALVVNPRAILGAGCTLRQCTTIGSKMNAQGEEGLSPTLGDRVDVGANVVILGSIRIGDDARIGAGSVVLHDVPAGGTVAGNPARPLVKRVPEASL